MGNVYGFIFVHVVERSDILGKGQKKIIILSEAMASPLSRKGI